MNGHWKYLKGWMKGLLFGCACMLVVLCSQIVLIGVSELLIITLFASAIILPAVGALLGHYFLANGPKS